MWPGGAHSCCAYAPENFRGSQGELQPNCAEQRKARRLPTPRESEKVEVKRRMAECHAEAPAPPGPSRRRSIVRRYLTGAAAEAGSVAPFLQAGQVIHSVQYIGAHGLVPQLRFRLGKKPSWVHFSVGVAHL